MTSRLGPGDPIPAFNAPNQRGEIVSHDDLAGHQTLLYFYPKALTGGCTTQSCLLRDIAPDIGDARIIGVSPDAPERQAKFDAKYELGFDLLSDPDHVMAEAFGVWGEKSSTGRSTTASSGRPSSSVPTAPSRRRSTRSAPKTPLSSCLRRWRANDHVPCPN
ncbi:MAG: redoxin domain-containing protein [Acidimicrobiales bacterium]